MLVALGQNDDAHPHDFMASDYAGEAARHWRTRYVDFIHALRCGYPKALIVLATDSGTTRHGTVRLTNVCETDTFQKATSA